MDNYRVVSEEANIQIRAARNMEKENPSRFASMLLAGYCRKIRIDISELKSYFDAGVTTCEIRDAVFKYRESQKIYYPLSDMEQVAPLSIKATNERVNMELEEYEIDGITPNIIDVTSAYVKLNIQEPHKDLVGEVKSYNVFNNAHGVGSIFNKETVKTVTTLKDEIISGLVASGYGAKKVPIKYVQVKFDMNIKVDGQNNLYSLELGDDEFSITLDDDKEIAICRIGNESIDSYAGEKITILIIKSLAEKISIFNLLELEESISIDYLIRNLEEYCCFLADEGKDLEYEQEELYYLYDCLADIVEAIIQGQRPMLYHAITKILSDGVKEHIVMQINNDGYLFEEHQEYTISKEHSWLLKKQETSYEREKISKLINMFQEHLKECIIT